MIRFAALTFIASLAVACAPSRSAVEAQPEPVPETTPETERAGELGGQFPDDWMGRWQGELRIDSGPGKPEQAVPMTLSIEDSAQTGAWEWTIQYADQPPRQYLLRSVEPSEGRYEIDERNSIVLPARRLGNLLVSHFAVGGTDIVTVYRLGPDVIEFELFSSAGRTETGGSEGAPIVQAYQLGAAQRAVLRRSP